MATIEFTAPIEFIARINQYKDCIMSQDSTSEDPGTLWFNIDVPKGHDLQAGDRVRITIEKV